jgi:autotransporter-associated beta strand protein
MNTTHKKNTTGLIRKWFTRGVACMALLFAAGSVQAASYTNTASGNWSPGSTTIWSNGVVGVSGTDTIIVFNPKAADNSTNNNTGAFSLNQLLVVPNYAVTLQSINGSSLNFVTSSGSTLPSITNAGTSTLTINSPITLDANLTVGASTSGAITINSNITETAKSDIIKLGNNTLTLTGSNTFSGNIYIKAGTLMDRQSSSGYVGNFGPNTATIYLGDATVGANATLQSGNNGFVCSNPIVVVSGAGTRTIQAMPILAQNPNFGGNITLNNDLQLAYSGRNANNPLNISGNITGTGNITFASTGVCDTSINLIGASINPVGAITNSSSSTRASSISGAIGTNVTDVVQNSATSALILSGSNAFTGNLYIKAGTLADKLGGNNGDTRNWGPPTATIYLGDATVGADATLATQSNAGYSGPASSINPINVVSGGGTRTIRVLPNVTASSWIGGNITLNNNLQFIYDRVGGVNLKISGNITGTGNLTFASTLGSGPITLTGASINPVGAITNSSLSTGASTISGAIGTNVTAVVQNSTSSKLILSGTNNTYAGTTTVLLGTLETQKTNSLGVASSLVIADGAKMYLNFTGTNTITSLKLGNVTMPKGVYGTNAPLDNLIFSGLGKLKVTTGPNGTLVRFY